MASSTWWQLAHSLSVIRVRGGPNLAAAAPGMSRPRKMLLPTSPHALPARAWQRRAASSQAPRLLKRSQPSRAAALAALAATSSKPDRITFRVPLTAKEGEEVGVAGAFSGWEPVRLRKGADGEWSLHRAELNAALAPEEGLRFKVGCVGWCAVWGDRGTEGPTAGDVWFEHPCGSSALCACLRTCMRG